MMSDQVSDWDSIEDSSFQQQWSSPYHGEVTVLHDFSGSLHDQPQPQPQPQPITTWPQTPCSSISEEDITYSDIFKVLSNIVQLQPSPSTLQASTTTRTVSLPILDKGKGKGESSVAKMKDGNELEHPWTQSKGTARAAESKKNQDDKRPKRTRSAETHNMSERMRRDRIRGKIRELQELIPNCYKTNRVSVLDEAIGYLKALKHQVEVMSMRGGIMCHAPYTSPTQYQGIEMRLPHYYPSIAMWPRMGFGIGMGSMSSSSSSSSSSTGVGVGVGVGVVMIPIPSPSLHSPHSAATAGVVPVPHVQLPFNPSQPLPAAPYVSVVQPTFHSRSQHDVPTICTDFQQQNMPMPMTTGRWFSSF